MNTDKVLPHTLHGHMIRLGIVEEFKALCRGGETRNAVLAQWCREKGVPENRVPMTFTSIRAKLGVSAQQGGSRAGSGSAGKPGPVRVWKGKAVVCRNHKLFLA